MKRRILLVLFLGSALSGFAAGFAHAELDGPLPVVDRAHPTTSTVDGATARSYPAVAGVHLICSPAFYAAHTAALSPYRDAQQTNLENVYAGDDPATPHATVALTFPNQATADAVKTQLLGAP